MSDLLLIYSAFPHSEMLAVTANSGVPVNSLIMVCVIDSFLLLLPLDKENGLIAFTAIVGLCVIGFQISYGIPILLRLIFRSQLPITSMSLGMWSLPCSVISCLWIFGTATLLFFPVQYPIEAKTFNWLILIVGFVVLIGTLNWRYNSRYTFKGPKRYVEQQPCDTTTVPNPIRAGGEAGDSDFELTINVGQSILDSPRNMGGSQRNFDHKYQRPSQS
jgi:amino acid transporter